MSRWYKCQDDTNVRTVQTSGWYKRRDGTNVGTVQTSGQYKRRDCTNVRMAQTLGRYKCPDGTNVGRYMILVYCTATAIVQISVAETNYTQDLGFYYDVEL